MTTQVEALHIHSGGIDLYARLRRAWPGAPLVVMLCGIGFHTFEYEDLATLLCDAGLNCLAFDYRGHGFSGGERGRWTLADLTCDAQAVLAHAFEHYAADPVVLFGNSLGGMIGMLTAGREPRVRTVIASNAPARLSDFMLTPARRALLRLSRFVPNSVPLRLSLSHFYSYAQLIDDPAWLQVLETDPLVQDARRLRFGSYRSLFIDWDGPVTAARLHIPLLLLQGRNDAMQPPSQMDHLFATAKEPKRRVLLDTGHLPHLEAPQAVRDAVLDWLRGPQVRLVSE